MKFAAFAILGSLICLNSTLRAQNLTSEPAKTPSLTDSVKSIRSIVDTLPASKRNDVRVGRSVLTNDDSTSLDVPDTLQLTAKQEAEIKRIIPSKATIKSLMLPGLGQAYNRQYYKIPFIYAGFGVMGYLFVKYRGLAQEAADGYRRLLYGDKMRDAYYVTLDPSLYPNVLTNPVLIDAYYVKPDYVEISGYKVYQTATAQNAYNTYRRYRDMNILLSVALWGLNVVEANVAAHLKTFDLTDDISMQIEPSALPSFGYGMVPGVRVALTFK